MATRRNFQRAVSFLRCRIRHAGMQLPTIKHIRPTCWSASALSCHTFPLISSRGVSRISGLRVCRVRSCPARRACTVPVRGSALSHRNLHHADRCPPWATRALGGRRARSLPSSLAANTWGGGSTTTYQLAPAVAGGVGHGGRVKCLPSGYGERGQ